ncbi:hypothetical protein AAFF_G00218350 [Aldrovandia affinis]|uniref:Uncharacterized protein n=1 Tax=Aldrovandia affinis TaxID=143900 RepID=A0AAD7SXW1_9TELE|nr:hypothetical protein AAFF_G00218350 [Aldrovandia affinis]
MLTEYTEILIDCLHEHSGLALSLDLKTEFIAIRTITIHCITALLVKTRKLRICDPQTTAGYEHQQDIC